MIRAQIGLFVLIAVGGLHRGLDLVTAQQQIEISRPFARSSNNITFMCIDSNSGGENINGALWFYEGQQAMSGNSAECLKNVNISPAEGKLRATITAVPPQCSAVGHLQCSTADMTRFSQSMEVLGELFQIYIHPATDSTLFMGQ